MCVNVCSIVYGNCRYLVFIKVYSNYSCMCAIVSFFYLVIIISHHFAYQILEPSEYDKYYTTTFVYPYHIAIAFGLPGPDVI